MKDLKTLDLASLSAINGGHHHHWHGRRAEYYRWLDRRFSMAAPGATIIIAR